MRCSSPTSGRDSINTGPTFRNLDPQPCQPPKSKSQISGGRIPALRSAGSRGRTCCLSLAVAGRCHRLPREGNTSIVRLMQGQARAVVTQFDLASNQDHFALGQRGRTGSGRTPPSIRSTYPYFKITTFPVALSFAASTRNKYTPEPSGSPRSPRPSIATSCTPAGRAG